MSTFVKELKYLSKVFDPATSEFIEKPVKKQASFLELSQTDRNQHKLFFMTAPLFEQLTTIGGEKRLIANPEVLHDLTVKAIDILLVVDSNFTEQDKKEFLIDGFAILNFGRWFLEEKYTPFFINSIAIYNE